MKIADEPVYLDDEDLLDVRLEIAETLWEDCMADRYPEVVIVESDEEFGEDTEQLNALRKEFKYHLIDDIKKKPNQGAFIVEFRDRTAEVTDEYASFV